MEPDYWELHNPQRGCTIIQRFASKVDAELFVEERKLEHPKVMNGWYVRAVWNVGGHANAAVAH